MPTAIELIVLALATWRVSSMLANEAGFGDSLERLRLALGVAYDESSERVATNAVAAVAMCPWCNSTWVGLAWMLFYRLQPEAAFFCALPFALSTSAILVMTSRGVQVFVRRLREEL